MLKSAQQPPARTGTSELDISSITVVAEMVSDNDRQLGFTTAFNLEESNSLILLHRDGMAKSALELGRQLCRVKGYSPKGEFTPYLNKVNIAPPTARRMMRAAYKFYTPQLQQLAEKLNYAKLLELITVDDDDLEALADGDEMLGMNLDDIDRMSPSELRKALRSAKEDKSNTEHASAKLYQSKDQKIEALIKRNQQLETGGIEVEEWPPWIETYKENVNQISNAIEAQQHQLMQLFESLPLQKIDHAEALQTAVVCSMDNFNRINRKFGQLQEMAEFTLNDLAV